MLEKISLLMSTIYIINVKKRRHQSYNYLWKIDTIRYKSYRYLLKRTNALLVHYNEVTFEKLRLYAFSKLLFEITNASHFTEVTLFLENYAFA